MNKISPFISTHSFARLLAVFAATLIAGAAWAQPVDVQNAWARATVPGQKTSGAFMVLKSAQPLRLIGVTSPVAGIAELHEMKLDGNVMRMRGVEALELPAAKAVELKPGGYHLMLMDLRQPLKSGSTIPLVLRFQGADKKIIEQKLVVEVRAQPPAHKSGHMEGHKDSAPMHSEHKH